MSSILEKQYQFAKSVCHNSSTIHSSSSPNSVSRPYCQRCRFVNVVDGEVEEEEGDEFLETEPSNVREVHTANSRYSRTAKPKTPAQSTSSQVPFPEGQKIGGYEFS